MRIEMRKFGNLLNGRPAAKEAFLRLKQIINGSKEDIILDFSGVEILTPSYADQLLDDLKVTYNPSRIKVEHAETPAVRDTISAVVANQ